MQSKAHDWMVSLHGGHSGDYCDHAEGSLRGILDAAIAAGYRSFGVSEHAPRGDPRFLYPNELNRGWTLQKTVEDFEKYITDLPMIAAEYTGRLSVVKGFEAEVVPTDLYIETMRSYRNRKQPNGLPVFDYMVGSVHFVNEVQIDGEPKEWQNACEAAGGPEALAVAYYDAVGAMIDAIRPEVVGHLDLIKRNVTRAGFTAANVSTEAAVHAARRALEAARSHDCILDLNTAGWRKGLGEPYPAPWLVQLANDTGVPFCFGDDSHRRDQVGMGIAEGRNYLLQLGVASVRTIQPGGGYVNITL